MKHLAIKNVGPIKHVDVELKRFNFFIGPQSSGKSTIAKVLSTCTWLEKEVCTTLDEKIVGSSQAFAQMMADFHKMEGYYNDDSEVLYESDFVKISLKGSDFSISIKPGFNYRRQKICYIPAERNMVTLHELEGFEFGQTNLRSFLFDWYKAREYYNPTNKTDILGLGVNYYYDKSSSKSKDHITHSNGQTYDISLSCASSGLQSLVPLLVMLQYYTYAYYVESGKTSSLQTEKVRSLTTKLENELVLKPLFKDAFSEENRHNLVVEVNKRYNQFEPEAQQYIKHYSDIRNHLLNSDKTTFIVEEPEQNLFPVTQRDMVQMMLSRCCQDKAHTLTITTHSPYILYSLNNCLLSYLVKDYLPEKERISSPAINPEEVGVWQIDKGGFVSDMDNDNQSIQDERGLIRKNFFDNVMRVIMDDFTDMLDYLD